MEQLFETADDGQLQTRRLRLSTLINTRWLAVSGQAVTVAIVYAYFEFELPILACILLIAVSVIVNLMLTWRYPPNWRVEPWSAFLILAFDVIQLSGMLYITGGLENPFSVLLVVPVVISAVSSPVRFTAALGALVFALSAFLVFNHRPLPWYPGSELVIPFIYLAGFWVAVIVSLGFSAFYISRVASEARRLTDALAATELVLQREMHLSALDGLAAAAAHELGTPLATISLVSKEMDLAFSEPPELKEDITLLRTQAQRCREILSRLSTLHTTSESQMIRLSMMTMIEEVISPHREFGVTILARRKNCVGPEPIGRRNPGILYGLGNLVENAVDFAAGKVQIDVSWDADQVMVEITDDGPGFAMEQVGRLGEPDIGSLSDSSRPRRGGNGLGLGVFIAKTLLERSGAGLRFANAPGQPSGAWVAISWPRKSIDTYNAYSPKEDRKHEPAYIG